MFQRACALVLVACGVGACGEGAYFGPPAVGLSVSVTPPIDTIFVTDTVGPADSKAFQAVVTSGATGGPVTASVTWTVSDPAVATIDGAGVAFARRLGTVTVTADQGGKRGTAILVVAYRTRSVQVIAPAVVYDVDDPISAADTTRLRAIARDRDGVVVSGTAITWRSSASTVASVDATGLVRFFSVGSATITASATGVSGSAALTVRPVVRSVSVTSPVGEVLALDTLQLSARATGQAGQVLPGRRFTWISSNPSVATVDSAGRVLWLRAGTATFSATTGFASGGTSVQAHERAFAFLDAGRDFTCAGANLGRGYCWGKEEVERLGVAADSTCDASPLATRDSTCTISPRRFAPAVTFRSVSAGGRAACGVGSDSMLYCWGFQDLGQLGDGRRGTKVSDLVVRATVGAVRFARVSVGGDHACAIATTDRIYCWGADAFGQLGDARRINSTTPIPLSVNFEQQRWSRVSAGDTHTCAVTLTGEAYCWGDNDRGQLGDGTRISQDEPRAVLTALRFSEIAAGRGYTCGITTDSAVACWGTNEFGQSLGTPADTVPRPPVVSSVTNVVDITAGYDHACARAASGQLQCWGRNDWGQLGNGNTSGLTSVPTTAASGILFRSVSAGFRHTCGIAVDGASWCWGSNVFGALGNELQAAARGLPQRVATPR